MVFQRQEFTKRRRAGEPYHENKRRVSWDGSKVVVTLTKCGIRASVRYISSKGVDAEGRPKELECPWRIVSFENLKRGGIACPKEPRPESFTNALARRFDTEQACVQFIKERL